MHGNVYEWCEDWYGAYPAGGVTDPKGAEKGKSRVLRGGSFWFDVSTARSAFRSGDLSPHVQTSYIGLRLAKTP